MKTALGVIPSRYQSSRFPGKPLADICGYPMIWWVYQQALKVKALDELIVATDDERIANLCEKYKLNYLMTSTDHNTPTSRLYEVSTKMKYDYYIFIGGDEPLIEPEAIELVVKTAKNLNVDCVNAMTKIKSAPEVIDFTNIKVVVSTKGNLLYTTRSPLPFPKGGLDFDYMKFVGIGAFSKKALQLYNDTPKSSLEKIEECDLLRFIDQGMPVKMVEVNCRNVSVDTPKDLEFVRNLIKKTQ
jgi:3-deoxy-manno-octulosonate cytidylyltransferase (CMP-KDO synthetase)